MTGRLRLTASARVADEIAVFVRTLAARGGLAERQAYRLRLAADEITTNIAAHGYCGAGGVVEIEGDVDDELVWLRIEDDARPFDPRSHDPRPVLQADPTARQEGGLGLFLALSGLDDFGYEYAEGRNRNTLIMRRSGHDGRRSE